LDILHAVILGIVQGLTEFLPVSSSGHLVLLQNVFGLFKPELLFDISLHLGTLIAVCVVFRQDILSLFGTLVRMPDLLKSSNGFRVLYKKNRDVRFIILLIIGNFPTALLGVFFHQIADRIFGSTAIVGLMLMITGILLWLTRYAKPSGKNSEQMKLTDALCIGFVQGLSILPGISRSGSTISTALFLGLDRELAGRYSFLMSVPAIIGAFLYDTYMVPISDIPMSIIFAGVITALTVGYLALILLLRVVKNGRLYLFSPYCWLLGIVTVIGY